jgi:hypothetical protein
MTERPRFAELLRWHMDSKARGPAALAMLSDIPKTTIQNWLTGRVWKPRRWQDVLKIGEVLRLD